MSTTKQTQLTKSSILKFLQCAKLFWMSHFQKELAAPMGPEQLMLFENGRKVGELARRTFPGGVMCSSGHFDSDGDIARTEKVIADGATTLFEATFRHDGVLVAADVLTKLKDGTWHLIEVKSSTKLKLDAFHIEELALQKHVIQGCGLEVSKTSLMHVNNQYVLKDELDVELLFKKQNCSGRVDKVINNCNAIIAGAKSALSQKTCVANDIGPHCDNPYTCPFREHCWQHIKEDSVLYLARGGKEKWTPYRDGVTTLLELPNTMKRSDQQVAQIESLRKQEPVVDKTELKPFLNGISYPAYFLDFESLMGPVPCFKNTKPYQQVVTQASLHTLQKDGDCQHNEFLSRNPMAPDLEIAKFLCDYIGNKGCVIVYHQAFEATRLKEMGERFPKYEHQLWDIISRLVDLEEPFRHGIYGDWRFMGSSSIKKVLPVLVPDLSYKSLAVQNGSIAVAEYQRMMFGDISSEEREQIYNNLLQYCELDTLAMVRIFQKLQEVLKGRKS